MMLSRVAAAGWLLAAAACTALREVQPAQFIPQHSPALVWVTTTYSAVVPVAQPRIEGDTLRGTWAGTEKPFAIPLQVIQSVQARTPARAQTVIMFATVGLVVGSTIWALAHAGSSLPADDCYRWSDALGTVVKC